MTERHGSITVEREDHIAIVEIHRPPHNYASIPVMRELADVLEGIDLDAQIRCCVLATEGKSFCAGADFSSPTDIAQPGSEGTRQLYVEAVRLFSTKKPIIALVQGAAIGAGLGLALVADFRIASPEARFSANFVKLGFHPGFGITYTLPRVIGEQKALLMCLSGRRIKAEQALEWHLVDEIVPIEQLRSAGVEFAHEIAENAPLALLATRKTLRGALSAAVKAQTDIEGREQAILRHTDDFAEGVRAVRERRTGQFFGR
jgi:enoyl-CoA hydratase/carnithine racemase